MLKVGKDVMSSIKGFGNLYLNLFQQEKTLHYQMIISAILRPSGVARLAVVNTFLEKMH